MIHLGTCVRRLFADHTVENIEIEAGQGERILYDVRRSAQSRVLTEHTLFDMASVTKILVTTPLALIAMDRGLLSPSDPVSRFFPVPADKRDLTIRHLLTHTMGIGHKSLLPSDGVYETIQSYILGIPLDIPIGTNVLYSCPAFILLGRILEKVWGSRLNEVFSRFVARPIGMAETGFTPEGREDIVNANLDLADLGVVNDYNCRYLGGVCGNAGVFSTMADLRLYVRTLIARGASLFSERIFASAVQNYTEGMDEARGLGYLYVDDRYPQTGGLFPTGSIGHCGHTGQSLFVDLHSGFYVIVLSDATVSTVKKYGQADYGEVMRMRRDIHAAIRADLGGAPFAR